jgi:ATP-dependent DNA helicase RecG
MPTLNQLLIAEATEYEFKSAVELGKPRSWLKTVCAYANGVGGSIYFGVSDDGAAVGLAGVQRVAEQVSELVKTRIDPAVSIALEPFNTDGKDILRLWVSGGASTPYYYTGEGTKTAYYRVGNESAPAPASILNELLLKGLHQTFDSLETKYRFSDYSYTLFEATYRQKTNNSVERPKDYHSFGMLSKNDNLTFVGALFADQCPIYQSRVFCTRWNGLKRGGLHVDALDNDEFQGGVISLLADALKFVRHNSSVKWRKTGAGRVEMPDYPPEAVHEALVNALVHRDYMIQGSEIHVDMYDDRLEIVSPGGMPDGKRIQDLNIDEIASVRRNPVICDIFNRLKLMERRGSGLQKIIGQYLEGPVPSFHSTEQSFIVTLKNISYGNASLPDDCDEFGMDDDIVGTVNDENGGLNGANGGLNDENGGLNGAGGGLNDENGGLNDGDRIIIIDTIRNEPTITISDMSEKIGIPLRTVERIVANLRKDGVINRVGSRKSGYWKIVEP